MGSINLSNIIITPLAQISTAGGDVLHALKNSDDGYVGFGEAYFSRVEFRAIKAWKRHTRMVMNITVPVGMVKFVFFADNSNEFLVEEIGIHRYLRLTVPPGIWFGFQGLEESTSLVFNLASIPHDPNEVERRSLTDIPYHWS